MGPYGRADYNMYDIRLKSGESDLCYDSLKYIDKYLNLPEVKKAIGAKVSNRESCIVCISNRFLYSGGWMIPYQKKVVEMLGKGLSILIYTGDKNFICNWLGNQAWTDQLQWNGADEFSKVDIRK